MFASRLYGNLNKINLFDLINLSIYIYLNNKHIKDIAINAYRYLVLL